MSGTGTAPERQEVAPQPQNQIEPTRFFDEAYNTTDNTASATTSAEASQLKEGWQKGDDNAAAAFKGLDGQLNQFDAAEAAVRQAQGQGQPPAFTDTAGANGAVTRTYSSEALKDYTHTFNKDGSVDLKVPASANLGFESVRFQGDSATVTLPGGETRAATAEELTKLNDTFKMAGGEFTVGSETGRWNLDARGNTQVEQVPGIAGGSMSVRPPNSIDDVRYRGEVKAQGDNPGYSTEATGTRENGWRFVDYDDSTASKNDPKTTNGQSIEGFVARRADGTDKPPLALTTNKPAGDGSVTTIRRDGTADTTHTPSEANGFKLRDVQYPADHPSGLQSETIYDGSKHPEGLKFEQRSAIGVHTQRQTRDGGFEISTQVNGQEVTAGYKSEADFKANRNNPDWSRETLQNGTVVTRYPEGHPSGLAGSEYNPGPPPSVKLSAGNPPQELKAGSQFKGQELSAEQVAAMQADFIKSPPAVQSEDLGNGVRRDVRADGKTETTWAPDKQPDKATLAKLTGLQESDARLNGITGFSRGLDGSLTLNYDGKISATNPDGRSFTTIRRDASGRETEVRDGKVKVGDQERTYTETVDRQAKTITREFPGANNRPGDMQVKDLESGAVKFERKVEGDKVTTTDSTRTPPRTEVRDYGKNPPEWSITEGDKTTRGTIRPGEKGQNLLVDEAGNIQGMEFTEGRRKGESYTFSRNPDGSLNGMEISIPARDGQPAQNVRLEKGEQGWRTNPPGQKVPSFDKAVADDQGNIKGDFSVTDKGNIVFESADKQTKEILRANGGRDTYNMKDYSRVREDADGRKGPTQYWDGYGSKGNPDDGWRTGTSRQLPDGRTEVVFNPPMEGRPSKMIRDGRPNAQGGFNNGFEVEFPNGTKYSVTDWGDGKMNRTQGGKTDTIYNTGAVGADGRLQWAAGREENGRVIFNDPRVASGEIPREAVLDKSKGEVQSTYGDGTQVTSDMSGRRKRIQPGHRGSTAIEPIYGRNGELKGYKQGDRIIERGPDKGNGNSEWTLKNVGGQGERKITGKMVEGPGGSFEIVGENGEKYESNGRFTTKEDGKDTVYDARGQKWQMKSPGDASAQPPTKPTWTVGDPPREMTGDLKLYNNGNVGVKTGEFVEMYNADKSVSKLDQNGIERERQFATQPPTYLKRDEVGALTEFKNEKGEVTRLEYADAGEGRRALTKVETKDSSGKTIRVERPTGPDGDKRLKVSQLNADGTEKNPPEFGNEVGYDRMGTRSETVVDGNKATTTITDIAGKSRQVKSENGRIVEAPDTASDATLSFKYDAANAQDKTPKTIHKGNDTNPYATRIGGAGSDLYNVGGVPHRLDGNGVLKPVNDNQGLDPCYTQHLEARRPEARPEARPEGQQPTEQQIDQALTQKYGLDAQTMPTLRQFAKNMNMESFMSPENIDKFMQAAKDNNLLQYLKPEHLTKIAEEASRIAESDPAAKAFIQNLLTNPQAVANAFSTDASINSIRQVVQEKAPSLLPFINKQFFEALLKTRQG